MRARPRQAAGELAGLFGLPAGEEVLESFACALVQTYGCQHNALTPPREARRSPSCCSCSRPLPPARNVFRRFILTL